MIGILSRLGGLGNFSSVLFFCLSLFLLVSVFRKQLLRIFLSLVFSIFLLLQLISLYFTQSFIGYQFISHFNLRGTMGIAGKFIPHLCFSALLLLVSILVFALSNKYFYKIIEHAVCHLIPPKTVKIVLIVFSLLFLFFGTWAGSFIADSKSLISIISNNKSNFTEVLKKYGMEDYITPEQVTCTQGKNIVIISLESYEKAYFSEKYQHLTPHLQQLKKEWNYFELEQNYGSNWTSGSLYTVLTGFPAYFGIEANDIFQQVYHSEISSISAIWDKTGYHSSFYNGNANFSGTKEMVHALGFHSVIDYLNIPDTGQYSKYGIRDKDLFEHAQREIKEHKCNNQPFAVFISTSDTHMPNGMYDKRMEQYIEPKENDLEFMVAAVDYMVGDFVGFLKKEKMLNETAVFIFPDHLKMGDPLPFENTGKRGLFLLSNTLSKQDSNKRAGPFFQIDLPKLILEGAGIQHNLKFLTDYIGKDKKQFVQDNILALTEINTNGLLSVGRPPLKPSPPELTAEQYRQDTFRYIAHAGGGVGSYIYTNSKEALDDNYKKGFRLFELDIVTTADGEFVAAHDWQLWAKIAGYTGKIPPSLDAFLHQKIYGKYTPLGIDRINDWFLQHPGAILVTDKVNEPKAFSDKFIDRSRLMMELFDMQAVEQGISCGIRSAMPSGFIMEDLNKERIDQLVAVGVKNIAISRNVIIDNKEMLHYMKEKGIKPYCFNIDHGVGVDFNFITLFEMPYVYGWYVDEWSFGGE